MKKIYIMILLVIILVWIIFIYRNYFDKTNTYDKLKEPIKPVYDWTLPEQSTQNNEMQKSDNIPKNVNSWDLK